MKYISKDGHVYKGAKPDGMSDEDYHNMMVKKGYKLSKSLDHEEVDMNELQKALQDLQGMLQKSDPTSEREALLEKALHGSITEDENTRLQALLAGSTKAESQSLAKSVTAQLDAEGNETIQKSLDVSEYLAEMHKGVTGALGMLSDSIEKSGTAQHNINLLFAKTLVGIGGAVDGLVKSLDAWGEQVDDPSVRAPKTPSEAAIQKSIAGRPGAGEAQPSKTDVLDVLEKMHTESLAKGMGGLADCGEDLMQAIAKYEQTMKMSPALIAEVKARA